jgi:hypothetical protein
VRGKGKVGTDKCGGNGLGTELGTVWSSEHTNTKFSNGYGRYSLEIMKVSLQVPWIQESWGSLHNIDVLL